MTSGPRGPHRTPPIGKGIHVCPRCGHIDLRGAPQLARILQALRDGAETSHDVTRMCRVSIQVASNGFKRLRELGLIRADLVARREGGNSYVRR